MKRTKIDYGIDLGTTNSAIARMDNGAPTITKTQTLKDTMPSCVNINKKGTILVGDSASNAFRSERLRSLKSRSSEQNTFIEFKRTMGTDKTYSSSYLQHNFSSEELSAEVIKTLKSFVDDKPKAIVVTIPAKFTTNQTAATMKAAKLAGFKHCELLQEPIAAALAYGVDSRSMDGKWLVFDFGGGTFDAALLNVVDGIIKVLDTEGDNHLGGKNIDYAIVDEILIPHLQREYSIDSFVSNVNTRQYLRDALKDFAETAKIELSFAPTAEILSDPSDFPEDDEGAEIELDITITEEALKPIVNPIFQKAIDISKDLLDRNDISGKNLEALILVGGPTYSPILREKLREQIRENIDTTIDPMTAVAEGAALFAATIDISEDLVDQDRDRTKIQLSKSHEPTTVEETELVTVKILPEKCDGDMPDELFVELVRGDKGWQSGRMAIDEKGEVIEVALQPGRANSFDILVYDSEGNLLPSEPDQLTIIQGTKIGSAPLSYNFGIGVMSPRKGYPVVRFIKGLEKNNSQPATGVDNGLKTQRELRPGMKEDCIKIPIYEADHGSAGTRLIDSEHVLDAIITGDKLPGLLPAESDVQLTFNVRDTAICVKAFFPLLEHEYDLELELQQQNRIDAGWLMQEISRAEQRIARLFDDDSFADDNILLKAKSELAELSKLLELGTGDYDRKKQVLDNLRKLNRMIENEEDRIEWPAVEEELKSSFYRLEEVFSKTEGRLESINDDRVRAAMAEFKQQIPQVIKERDVGLARDLIERISRIDFVLVDAAVGVQMEIDILNEFDEGFDIRNWTDPRKARLLINQGLAMISTNASKEALRPLVRELFNLLPDESRVFEGDESLLRE